MISESDALARILSSVTPLPHEPQSLNHALGAYATQTILADIPLPGFDNSAMDGYAVQAADTESRTPLTVIGEAAAGPGSSGSHTVTPGTAVRIFTGAPMPAGADAVIMQEDVTPGPEPTTIVCSEPVKIGENVRLTGCDLCAGQRIISSGDRLTPARLAVLASQGLTHVTTASPPRIAVVTTGDELVPPGQALTPGQIYNSNAVMLASLIREVIPSAAISSYHLPDDLALTIAGLREAITSHDFLVLSGGVSVGDHDCIKPALEALSIPATFWRVKVKPGKPVLFAKTGPADRPCHIFGLPGNPVSSQVTFHLFVRPALLRAIGAPELDLTLPSRQAILAAPLHNHGDRPHYLRGILADSTITPAGVQQSHALFSLSQANAYLRMEPEQSLEAGTQVTVLHLD